MAETDRPPRGARAARRRHLTILFADLSDFTALTESLEPEYCVEIVDHLKRCAERVIPKYGGIVVSYHGDGVMAMFGFPEPSEDDGRRATEAALALHEAIRHSDDDHPTARLPSLRLHSGIHCGLVLVIENDPSPGAFSLMGGPPTIATRLSDIAKGDEILVSTTTLGGDSHFFETRERGELTLQGKAAPVGVIQVLRHSLAGTRFEARTQGGLTPFVGRGLELAVLDLLLADAARGNSREVSVVASAGFGKTRLLEEFLQRIPAHTVQVCRGYCETSLGAEPRQPFVQMLRELARGNSPAEAAAQLQTALAMTTSPGVKSADEAATSFCNLFAALTVRKPLVLIIDDWQWADAATRQVLATVRERELPFVLILTASREPLSEAEGQRAHVIDLTPLNHDETVEAILRLRPGADPFAVQEIRQLSGGNPLFIEELCHWTSRERARHQADRDDNLPAWLSTLIESRVGRLPAPHADAVRAAAVIGAVIPAWLLEQVTGHADHDRLLRDLAERDFIFPGEIAGTLRFKHGVTRDIVYASVGLREREALHRRIAGLLEQRSAEAGHEAVLEPLSYHFAAAAEPERAAHYAELAGDKALSAAAPDRARVQYTAALAALDGLPQTAENYRRWSRIIHRLGLACVFDPARDQLRIFERAAAIARARGDESGIARAEYWLGFIHYAIGDPQDAIEHYETARLCCGRAIEASEQRSDPAGADEMKVLSVQLVATIGQARASAGQFEAALQLLDEALAVKRQHRRTAHPAVGSAYALACKGALLGDLGRFEEAHACFEESLDAIRAGHSAVEASIVGWLSAVYLWQGRWDEAREAARRAQGLAQRVESLYVFAMSQTVEASATWVVSRTPDCIDAMIRATTWLELRDKRMSISMNYGWIADAAAADGRVREARVYAGRAIRRARRSDVLGEATACRALATLPWPEHGRTRADYLAQSMRSALARRSSREEAMTWLHQAELAAGEGRTSEACQLLQRARSAFVSMKMSWHIALAERRQVELSPERSAL